MTNSLEHLIEQTMQMKPDRMLVSEIRGLDEVELLLKTASGHHGTITTIHAVTQDRQKRQPNHVVQCVR
ncbi:putative conjugal transfer proteinc [Peptococcaceae bacterium CEB3]|nr:putative conjugal transfer proteinc [Peptococcaceae bacterium CEB3]